jgi:hypothetical protein
MSIIDRVMRAYSRKHTLTDAQTSRVRSELSAFIEQLMLGKLETLERPAGSSTPDGKL